MGLMDGKVVLITSAAGGMGEQTARLFASEDARVILADIAEAPGKALAEELGSTALFAKLNVSDETDRDAVVSLANERFGGWTSC